MSTKPTKPTTPIRVSDDAYEVGYGKPPKHTRFKSGQSGNPRGRRSHRSWENPLMALLLEPRKVILRGKRTTLPTYELLLQTYLQKAFQGDHKALKMFLDSTDHFKTAVSEDEEADHRAITAFCEQVRARLERNDERRSAFDRVAIGEVS